MSYPRPVRAIHQIELTTYCSLRCVYCPSPKLEELRSQPKQHMAPRTFERALEWAVRLNDRRDGLREELSLTGIGEALDHPDFVAFLARARARLPVSTITFSTNGLKLDDAMCRAIAPYKPRVYVSLHRPEKAAFAIQAARKYGLLEEWNPAPAVAAFNWAGAVPWPVSAPPVTCEYLRSGWGVVLVDGRGTYCCLGRTGAGVVGDVDDPIESLTTPGTGLRPWGTGALGCKACHMTVPM